MIKIPTISEYKSDYKTLFTGNKYYVHIKLRTDSGGINDMFAKARFRAKEISLGTPEFQETQINYGGYKPSIPTSINYNKVDLTFINSGTEYKAFQKWANLMYNPKDMVYGYFKDYVADMVINEVGIDLKTTLCNHYFTSVTINTLGGIRMAYDLENEIETFECSLTYQSYTYYNTDEIKY